MSLQQLKKHPLYGKSTAAQLLDLLDLDQAASLCGITRIDMSAMFKDGRLPERLFEKRKDERTGYFKWYVRRSDIPDLKEAIAKAAPSNVKSWTSPVLQTMTMITIDQIVEETGIQRGTLKYLRVNGKWPKGFKEERRKVKGVKGPGTLYVDARIVLALTPPNLKPAQNSGIKPRVIVRDRWLTIPDIAYVYGTDYDALAQRFRTGSWPHGIPKRQRGKGVQNKMYEFHPSIIPALASYLKMANPWAEPKEEKVVDLVAEQLDATKAFADAAAEAIQNDMSPMPEPTPVPELVSSPVQVVHHNNEVKLMVSPGDYITWTDVIIFLAARGHDTACADVVRHQLTPAVQNSSAQK